MDPDLLTEEPLNAETSGDALEALLTPRDAFFKRNHFAIPEAEGPGWELAVEGGTEGDLVLSLEDLASLGSRTGEAVLECAGNGRTLLDPTPGGTPWRLGAVGAARWSGHPLEPLLRRAGVPGDAVEVLFVGADGTGEEDGPYARSLPLEVALRPSNLLARRMNGGPLPPEHGHPLRLLVPGWYGMAHVKWLRRIAFLSEPFRGPFQTDEYVFRPRSGETRPVREILPRALVVAPRDGAEVEGPVELRGWAWAGEGPVERVEVRGPTGDGWSDARLGPPRGPHAWRSWSHELDLPTGAHRIAVRATDAGGRTQPDRAEWNEGGYESNAPHEVEVTVRSRGGDQA